MLTFYTFPGKRQSMSSKEHILDTGDAHQSRLHINYGWNLPNSFTAMPWVGSLPERGHGLNGLFSQPQQTAPMVACKAPEQSHNEARQSQESSRATIEFQNLTSPTTHPYMYAASMPSTENLSLPTWALETDTVVTNMSPSLLATKDLDGSTLNGPIARHRPTASPRSLPHSSEGYSTQNLSITPPSSSHQQSSIRHEGSPDKVSYRF
jgi:hypothetical protein